MGGRSWDIITPNHVYEASSSADVQGSNPSKNESSPLLTLSCYFYNIFSSLWGSVDILLWVRFLGQPDKLLHLGWLPMAD